MSLELAVGAAAFVITLLATPVVARSARAKGLTGRDVNKPSRPLVANFGGFALYAGFTSAVLLAVLANSFLQRDAVLQTLLLAAVCSISLLSLVGAFDDLFKLSRRIKVLLPAIGALPLIAVTAGQTVLNLPFVGAVNFGLLYTFAFIPLGVTGAANAVNMLAGYNGLEAGSGAVMSAVLLVIALAAGQTAAAVLLAALLGACLAFLFFNWFPARIFPSDIGTYIIGGTLATAVIFGNMEKFGVLVLLPAFYEFAATVYYGLYKRVDRRAALHNPPIKNNRIVPKASTRYYTLSFLLASLSRNGLTEKQVTLKILALYALSGLLALAVYALKI